MKQYGVNELRSLFLDFFVSKGHLSRKSYSLVPHNDKSLLLINSGMAPLKSYFTGQELPPSKRMATCQKCIRTGDIENVGITARHLTFFEMLGNFSFGDYFKKEALAWSWEFLTKVVGLEEDRLYPSIYYEDEESFTIWTEDMNIPEERITRFYRDENGKSDNFWEHGAGPCGPCSEIYYDRGEKYGCKRPDCQVGCECDRFIEVWNNVFTQFEGDGKGNYTELIQKNIDTGMGLERLAVVVQGADSVFDIDTMKAIRNKVCDFCGIPYQSDSGKDVSIRLITDHIRSAAFMISDGIMPSNEGRGYVLRRLIRRAARHGRLLGIRETFLAQLSETVIQESRDGYQELAEKQDFIYSILTKEEEKFSKTIDQGLTILKEMQADMQVRNKQVLSGEDAFKLYDTYGFPVDLTEEILAEQGFSIDYDGFEAAMNAQKEKARKARKVTNYMGTDETIYESIDPALTSDFVGYDQLTYHSPIIALTTKTELSDALTDGENGTILVKETPFYAAGGGQAADTGCILSDSGAFQVLDTVKLSGGKIGHIGTVTKGMFRIGERVRMSVNEEKRMLTARNHSATHLLQKALRTVLGTHVEQAGSDVNSDRLRFDFSHFSAMTEAEIRKTEDMVNNKIAEALPVKVAVMSMEEAKQTGAMALFGEKYSDQVRVVSMGDFSIELCGGTHVENTSKITAFKIISESGVAAGVRRIEALTSTGVFKHYNQMEAILIQAAKDVKSTPAGILDRIKQLNGELKLLQSENESLKSKAAKDALGDVMDQRTAVNGVSLLAVSVDGVDMQELRDLGDQLKEKIGEGVIVLASAKEGKVSLIAMATEEAMKRGAHAGNLIKSIAAKVGGGGGGRPNMAQAGGKNPQGINDAIAEAKEVLKGQIV